MEDAVIEEESMKEIDQEGTSIPFYHFPSVVFATYYYLGVYFLTYITTNHGMLAKMFLAI